MLHDHLLKLQGDVITKTSAYASDALDIRGGTPGSQALFAEVRFSAAYATGATREAKFETQESDSAETGFGTVGSRTVSLGDGAANGVQGVVYVLPLTGQGLSYDGLKFLKPSGDRFLFRDEDADAAWDLFERDRLRQNPMKIQYELYSRRMLEDYVPTINDPLFFPSNRLKLRGGPDMGQGEDTYGSLVGASNGNVPERIMQRADKAPIIVTGVLGPRNVMQEWQPLEMYLRELWHAAHTGAISPTDLNDAVHSLSKGKFANVQDAITDISSATPTFFTSLEANDAFVNGLSKRVAIPSYDSLLPRIIDYGDRQIGDIVAISVINSTRQHDTLPNMGFAAHDFNEGIPGLHLGDTMPVSLFDIVKSVQDLRKDTYNDDGTINWPVFRRMLGRLVGNKPLIEPDVATLRRLAIPKR